MKNYQGNGNKRTPLLANYACWEHSSADGLEGSGGPQRQCRVSGGTQHLGPSPPAQRGGDGGEIPRPSTHHCWMGTSRGTDWAFALFRVSVVNEPIPTSARRDSLNRGSFISQERRGLLRKLPKTNLSKLGKTEARPGTAPGQKSRWRRSGGLTALCTPRPCRHSWSPRTPARGAPVPSAGGYLPAA